MKARSLRAKKLYGPVDLGTPKKGRDTEESRKENKPGR
jgi:hypothetical protein